MGVVIIIMTSDRDKRPRQPSEFLEAMPGFSSLEFLIKLYTRVATLKSCKIHNFGYIQYILRASIDPNSQLHDFMHGQIFLTNFTSVLLLAIVLDIAVAD